MLIRASINVPRPPFGHLLPRKSAAEGETGESVSADSIWSKRALGSGVSGISKPCPLQLLDLFEEPDHLFATFPSIAKDGCGVPRAGQPFTSFLL